MNQIAIVILNFNGKHFLAQFLPSVIEHSQNHRIVVADNGSSDDSIIFLKENYPQIQIIQIPENQGFSKGYNTALKQIEARYYVLLNSDVEVSPNWIEPMLDFMEKNPQVGACQPKIKSFHEKNKFEYAGAGGGFIDKFAYPFCRGRIFDKLEEDNGQYDDTREVFWASGACMFVKAEAYHKLGGLDDDFFAHMEEIDLCWRMKNSGYAIYYIGKSEVYHVGGGTLAKDSPFKVYLNFRNCLAMIYKNCPNNQLNYILFSKFLLDGLAMLFFLLKGHSKSAGAITKAYSKFYGNLKLWKNKRKKIAIQQHISFILPKSLVWQYFLWGKKRFSDYEKFLSNPPIKR